jgi:mono/diheme cytochrome c family protein
MLKSIAFLFCTLGLILPIAAQTPIAAPNPDPLPDGAGKPIVQRMCTGCHSLKTITSKHATKEQWSMIVQQMVSRGADGTDEEIEQVINYLAANFPPEKDKTPTPPAISRVLNLSKTQLDSILNRRHDATNEPTKNYSAR